MKPGSGEEKSGGLLHEPGAEVLNPSSRFPFSIPLRAETCPPGPWVPRHTLPAAAGPLALELAVSLGLRVCGMGDGGGHRQLQGVGTDASGQVRGAPARLRSWGHRLSLSAHWGNTPILAGTVPSPPVSSVLDGSMSLSRKSSSQSCSKGNCLPG